MMMSSGSRKVLAIWLTFYVLLSIIKKFTVLNQAQPKFCNLPDRKVRFIDGSCILFSLHKVDGFSDVQLEFSPSTVQRAFEKNEYAHMQSIITMETAIIGPNAVHVRSTA